MDNRRLARWGETVAAAFFERRGARVVSRNRRIGRDEIDLIVVWPDRVQVAVEVKTRVSLDPVEALHDSQVARLLARARGLGIARLDLCAVRPGREGVWIHWIPHAS